MSTTSTLSNISAGPQPVQRHHNVQKNPPVVPGDGETFFGKGGPSFGDLLDVINPLQHIPIVSTIYRQVTGDAISPATRLAGGALLGGPLGFLLALGDTVVQGETGHDIGEHAYALVTGGSSAQTQLASADSVKSKPQQLASAAVPKAPQQQGANLPPDLPGAPDVIFGGTDIPAALGASSSLPTGLPPELTGISRSALAPSTAIAASGAAPKLSEIPRADARNVDAYNQYYRAQLQAKQSTIALKTAF